MVRASAWMSPGSQDANAANVGAGSIVKIGSGELELRFFTPNQQKTETPSGERKSYQPAASIFLYFI